MRKTSQRVRVAARGPPNLGKPKPWKQTGNSPAVLWMWLQLMSAADGLGFSRLGFSDLIENWSFCRSGRPLGALKASMAACGSGVSRVHRFSLFSLRRHVGRSALHLLGGETSGAFRISGTYPPKVFYWSSPKMTVVWPQQSVENPARPS